VEGGTTLFSLVVEPITYEDMMESEFEDTEVIEVGPEEGGGEEGFMPRNFALALSYYQKGKDDKILIMVEMDYDTIEEVTPEQFVGDEPVDYSLTFSLISFSHKDLTIKFAFEAYFYIVLYMLMGLISIIFMAVFGLYHRIVARPNQSEGSDAKVAPFKLLSYYSLTIP